MIDDQLREYARLLTILYGDGMQLDRYLGQSLSDVERIYVLDIIHGRPNAALVSSRSHASKEDSHRRAKARLAEKLDSVVLAHQPTQRVPKRVEITRDVFSQLTTASLAMRTELRAIAKHKLHLAVRQIVLPDLIEAKLFALRKLYLISLRENNYKDINRYYDELQHYTDVYRTILPISLLLGQLLHENAKKKRRHNRLQRVADESSNLLNRLNVNSSDPLIIIAACPLATAVAQIQNDYNTASIWLRAFKRACEDIGVWNDSHRTEWLMQQLAISEYFEKRSKIELYTRQLFKLARPGTEHWFVMSDLLCVRAFKSGNYALCAEISYDAISNDRFRRQRLDIQRSILQRAGYAAVLTSNAPLYKTYKRRLRLRTASLLHARIVDFLYALQNLDIFGAFTIAENIYSIIDKQEVLDRDTRSIRKLITSTIAQLKRVELVLDARKQRQQLKLVIQQLRLEIGPVTANLL
jgi:hypothetical protein